MTSILDYPNKKEEASVFRWEGEETADIVANGKKGEKKETTEGKETRVAPVSRKVNYSKDLGRERERERERTTEIENNHAGGNNNPVHGVRVDESRGRATGGQSRFRRGNTRYLNRVPQLPGHHDAESICNKQRRFRWGDGGEGPPGRATRRNIGRRNVVV